MQNYSNFLHNPEKNKRLLKFYIPIALYKSCIHFYASNAETVKYKNTITPSTIL